MFEANIDTSIDYYETVFNTSEVMKDINKDGQVESPKFVKSKDPDEGVFRNEDNRHLFDRYYPPFGNSENKNYLNIVLSDD